MKCHRYVCLLLQVISFAANCLAENLILDINFKKPIAVTDHAFLSFTLDPITLQHNDFIKNIEKSTNLARGLAPAYIRLGGPQSNFYNFEQVHSHEVDMDPNDMHFGTQWALIYQWAKNAGLDVIACITPHYIDNELKTNSRDPRNIAEILTFSDRMGYNISWQLGYECQTRCDLSGEELGRYVANLHEMLKTFPRYSNSLITGPDIVAYKTAQQQKYFQDYLQSANAALSAITWHPDFDNVSLNNDNISVHYDNMIAEKNEMYKIISRVAGDKPLWIAESKPQENNHHYLDALIWTRRLGDAAKLGIQIVMKQLSDLSQATPIYWVSLLYKTLVDREVLETKLQYDNESYVHFYSQCTKPSAMYSKGAITIFGINLTPKNVTASLKGFKIKILHRYILLPDFETGNKMFSEKVLLNNKPLNLINDENLPHINPEIIINPDGLELELPSGGIGFWIIPNAKVKACTCSEEATIKNNIVKQLSKRDKNNIQQDNREEKEEEHINQSNVIEDNVKENKNQSFLKNWKIYGKQDSKKQENVENTKAESQQKVWSSKLFAKIKKNIQKKLDENESSDLQRSFIIDLGEEQEKLSAEVKKQQNFDNKSIKKIEVDDFKSIRNTLENKRNKRSNWEELQKIFVQEMIKENEENAKDCHRRVIRAFDSLKKLYYHRIKRNASIPTARFTDTSSENKSVSTDVARSKKNSITREKYEEIMTGEILPNTNVNELYKENDTTTESVITELSTLDHKLSDTTQAIDVTLISEVDNVSEQYHNAKKSTTNLLPIDSDSKLFLNNNNSVKYVTEKTFFRAQLPDVQSKNKTKTYDSSQVISKIPSENKDNREKLIVPITKDTQETICEKVQGFIDKKEKADGSIFNSTITEDQKNEEGHNDDYKIRLKSINSLKKTKKDISEQMTTETILPKQATSTVINNIISNESNTKSKLLQNTEDNQNSEWKARIQLEKYTNTRRLNTILQNLSRTSLERLTRHEEQLTKHAEQIDKRKEKLHARREKLLHQYQNELTKIADEQKRNLQRREAWERLRENDDFRRLIDQNFIGILLDDDVIYEGDDESYLIPIKLVPKQCKNIIDQIYLLGKAKEMHYPEYYQNILRNLIEDDEELVETSKSSERKYNQYYEYILKRIKDTQEAETSKFLNRERNQNCQYSSETIEDERESTETTSRSFDRKVFIIDPSTYYGGEPILQLHEDYLKLPKYHSKMKTQIQDPITRWILKNIYQVQSSEVQHQASKSQEYIEELPIRNYAQGNANILYVLDTRRQYDSSKELAALAHIWQNSLYRRDANQALSNKEADELNKMHKNLEADKDNLVSTFGINEKAEFIRDFETEKDMKNKEFTNSNNRKKDIMNSETTEDAEEDVKTKKLENIELIKQEEINKSYNLKDEAKNNLNIKMFNNNDETATHVEKIIEDDPKGKKLGKENTRSQRDVGKQADEYVKRLPDFILTENMRNKLDRIHVRLKEELKKIFDKQPTIFLLIKNDKSSNAGLFWKSKNYIVKINQQNEKEHDLNYITLIPIEIKNIYEMLDAKNNDDSLERFKILVQWDDQYILGKIPGSMNKYLNDETSEEFEYEDLANLQSKNSESILDEESRSCENKQDISVEDSEAEKDKQYRITKDKINKYLKIENQVGPDKHGILLLFPWRNVKKRQQRQIKSEIDKDIAKIKREVTRQSQTTKFVLAKDFENTHKRSKRYYLNNNIDKEEEENMIETNDIRANDLKPQINRKNRDDLLEDFIKARKSNNLNNNEASSLRTEEKNELMPLNNISKGDKKLLQKEISTIQNHMESMEQFVNDPEEGFNDTLTSDNDKHHRSKISETTGNAFHTAIMNIKDFFAFFF